MRVFLDTIVLVSAAATRGLCADVLREVLVSHQLMVSHPLIEELKRVLHIKIGLPGEIVYDLTELLVRNSIFPENTVMLDLDIKDRDDIIILSTAVSARAEIFVTGDRELLELKKIQTTQIVSPRKFWEMLREDGS